MARKPKFTFGEAELDLVPMIDCIFLLLLFFMLCGRITMDQRTELITVPPTKTATKLKEPEGWSRVVINVFGSTQHGDPPMNSINLGTETWKSSGIDDYRGYIALRDRLDHIYDGAPKYDDPKATKMKLPKVVVEIRADGDTEYRVVQEVQQILSDTIDPTTMLPRKGFSAENARCFVNLDFTARLPDGR